MPAYLIAQVDVQNMDRYKDYVAEATKIAPEYGGKFIVRGGAVTTLEGPDYTRRLVILEFPSMEKAQAFYNSEAYQAAKAIRLPVSDGHFVLVEGYGG